MVRRTFVYAIAGALLVAPPMVYAQRAEKVYRIGYLREGAIPLDKAFWDAMREYGWVEGQNVMIQPGYADRFAQLRPLAKELVRLSVDLIIAIGTAPAQAAQTATTTIPIVFSVGLDPTETGLVSSLARPGANLTGFVMGLYDEKLLQVLKEALPGMSRAAYPRLEPLPIGAPPVGKTLGAAGRALRVEITGIPIKGPEDFGRFYAAARASGADAVVMPNIAPFMPYLNLFAAEAAKSRIPTIGFDRRFVEAGGLLSYGPIELQRWPRIAAQVDRILRGTNPGDLPVEQPTRFELVINLKAAKALGLPVPQSLLLRADEVIK